MFMSDLGVKPSASPAMAEALAKLAGDPELRKKMGAAGHSRVLHWTPPAAGAICFFSYQYPIDSMDFVDRLIREYSTMIVPGVHFRAERHLRIGFGMEPRILHSGLAAIDRLLTSLD